MFTLAVLLPILQPLVEHVVVPVAVGAITAGSAWVFTKLPGPARDWLQADTHQKDLALITGAMARSAAVALTRGETSVTDAVISYVKTELPDTLRKLAPSNEALQTMAAAAVTAAIAQRNSPL